MQFEPEHAPLGVILAGGLSSRFGGAPKGLARVDGARIVDRVASALGATCGELLLIANAPDAAEWLPGVRVERDVRPGLGALGGVHAALAHAAGRDVIVVAWDMPFVPGALISELARIGGAGADAVVPVGPAGAEPLCAFYAARCLDVAARLLDSGERRARALAESVRTTWVRDVERFGAPERLFASVNTPGDLARLTAAGP